MRWKVLITARAMTTVGQGALDLLRTAGCELTFADKSSPLTAEELRPLLAGKNAVLASLDQYSASVLTSPEAASLAILSRWGVGYDSVDVAAATQAGIVVAYTPGLLDEAVADYAFALLLALARRVHEGHGFMREGRWMPGWGHDVAGKTLGLVGCGRIGQAMARRGRGFAMRLLGYDIAPSSAATELGIEFVTLDHLLAESDFVSLHAAVTPTSIGLLGAAQLRRMKPTAYLVNTARGALVDEAALARALTDAWIAGAALDVYTREPLPAEHALRGAPNLLLSPHQSSFGRETGERVSLAAAQAIVDLMQGRRPALVLNPEVFAAATFRAGSLSSELKSNP